MSQIRKSSAYDYFVEETDKFTCSITKEGNLCATEIKSHKSGGALSGNLKRHLKLSHPEEFKSVEAKDELAKRNALERGQTTINAFLPRSSFVET